MSPGCSAMLAIPQERIHSALLSPFSTLAPPLPLFPGLLLAFQFLPEFLVGNALAGLNPLAGSLQNRLQARGVGRQQTFQLLLVSHRHTNSHRPPPAG